MTGGRTELTLQVHGRGKTLYALLGSLDGQMRVQVGPLKLRSGVANLDRGVVTRTLDLANPVPEKEPETDSSALPHACRSRTAS